MGSCSDWVDPDADDCPDNTGSHGTSALGGLAAQSVSALKSELGWAGHLGLQAVVMPAPKRALRTANYAHVVNQVCLGGGSQLLSLA